jgi:hypothetical protein
MANLKLTSGRAIAYPLDRFLSFCTEEWAFYDAVHDPWPDHVTPVDVAITIAVNSIVNNAARLRQVQRGLAEACDPILASVPVDARLDDDQGVEAAGSLMTAAVAVASVLVPVATKVLYRKRPSLVPMLDQPVLDYYLDATGNAKLKATTQDKRRAAGTAILVLDHVRRDLIDCRVALDALAGELASAAFTLAPMRILDILLWTEIEPRGYSPRPRCVNLGPLLSPGPLPEVTPSVSAVVLPDVCPVERGHGPHRVHVVRQEGCLCGHEGEREGGDGLIMGALDPDEQVALICVGGASELGGVVVESRMVLAQRDHD